MNLAGGAKFASCLSSIPFKNALMKRRLTDFGREMATLETLNFDNRASTKLPIDQIEENTVRVVSGACYSKVIPTPVVNPKLVALSKPALGLLDISDLELERKDFVEYFSGNKLLPGSSPVAHCYCGHQFGYFAGQLGDGAAITLGEIVNKSGERWEFQLKGAGKTPYSRTADGRKVLRSSIREFLCSEAMHFLGIPTTRAGCIITSDTQVIRDVFYDGNPILEKCSIVCRIAPTFIRFGSFQICKGPDRYTGNSGPSASQPEVLKSLLDYVIETYYHDIWTEYNENFEKMYVEFFGEVVRRTAHLVAQWQCVGWCHGVLNTDNMSIIGLTIDYGPFGFLDHYDPSHICNASDVGGRYSYENQPEICRWNCEKLAEVLQIFTDMAALQAHLDTFNVKFEKKYMEIMRKKFGFMTERDQDRNLIEGFLKAMEKTGADFTNSFRCLSSLPLPGSRDWQDDKNENISSGKLLLKEKLLLQCASVQEMMIYNKPNLDPSSLRELILFLESPAFERMMDKQRQQVENEIKRIECFNNWKKISENEKKNLDSIIWDEWLTSYIERLKIEAVEFTKSFGDNDQAKLNALNEFKTQRISIMNSTNPSFILRNYIAQEVIDAAEMGDYSKVKKVLEKLERPYEDDGDDDELKLTQKTEDCPVEAESASCRLLGRPLAWSSEIRVT